MIQSPQDNLFSKNQVRQANGNSPLLVVGLPRSGSSFLSEVISQIDDWYVFDDLYLHRKAIDIGATGVLTGDQFDTLLHFLGWQIRARLRFGKYAVPKVKETEIDAMNAAIKHCLLGTGATWVELQQEWMTRLANRNGCNNWGYKMPQSFRYLDQLFDHYPDMKVIFLMRAPQNVLASYKHMHADSEDGDPAQYHPIAHAMYWRLAATSYIAAQARYQDKVRLIKFEDLTADPSRTAKEIAGFLGAQNREDIQIPPRPNSSFKAGVKRKTLNGLETVLLNTITRQVQEQLGYQCVQKDLAPGDFLDFFRTTGVFLRFRLRKLIRSKMQRLKH